jgi:hypothetical protein
MADAVPESDDLKESLTEFLKVLGLLDLVTGALGLYAVFDWLRGSRVFIDLFPSTGTPLIDLVLLACVAALVGKIIGIAAEIALGIVELVAERVQKRYMEEIRGALKTLAPGATADALHLGEEIVSQSLPDLRASMATAQKDAHIALSAMFLVIPYGLLLASRWSSQGGDVFLVVGVVVSCFASYVFKASYIEDVRTRLQVLAGSKP